MSNTSEFITIIRPSFMKFCEDACRAAAFNHLLFRIAGKSKDQPKEKIVAGDILWYAKTEQITEEMANAWGVCKVRKEVNALIDMGIVGRRANPEWGADRTKHFCFGQKECKKFLGFCEKHEICVVHLGLSPEVTHLIYSSNANDTSIKCICPQPEANDKSIECIRSNHQMEAIEISDANDKSIEAIPIDLPTEDDYKDDTKEESNVAPERRNAPASLTEYKQRKETDPQMPVVKPTGPEIPPEAARIMDDWDANHKKPTPRTKKFTDAALLLVPFNPSREDLRKCEGWLYTTDRPGKPWFRSHGVSLSDIAENISKWQSLQEAPPPEQESPPVTIRPANKVRSFNGIAANS